MLVINRLTAPGEIKRVEIRPDIVYIVMQDGRNVTYQKQEVKRV